MTDAVTNSTTQTQTQNSNAAPSAPQTDAEKANRDFENFLSLLTAQLRNQDPLAPLDSTQFVEQLASFSSVEQQVKTNTLLEDMISANQQSGLEGASDWIGKSVDAASSRVQFNGAPINMRIAEGGGDPVEFVVKNASGDIVYQEPLSVGQKTIDFEGVNNLGVQLPKGTYEVAVNYASDGVTSDSKPPLVQAKVMEAYLDDGDVLLALDNGSLVEPGEIVAIRQIVEAQVFEGDGSQGQASADDSASSEGDGQSANSSDDDEGERPSEAA